MYFNNNLNTESDNLIGVYYDYSQGISHNIISEIHNKTKINNSLYLYEINQCYTHSLLYAIT